VHTQLPARPHKSNRGTLAAIERLLAGAVAVALLAFCQPAHSREPLTGAVITGSSAYSQEALFPMYRDSLGRQIDSRTTHAILTKIESKYLRDGYVKPLLIAHDEPLAEGVLRVDVYEARVTGVRLSGDAGPHQQRVARVAQELQSQTPLRQSAIPLGLKALRTLPGLAVEASTRADSTVRNGVVLLLRLHYKPLSAEVTWSNWGTSEIGPNFVSTTLSANGFLGGREQLSVLLISATDFSNYHGAGATFAAPLNEHGTSLAVTAFHSAAQPNFSSLSIDLAYPHDLGNLQLSQALLDNGRESLRTYMGIDYDDSLIQYQGVDLQSDRLRVGFLGLQSDGRVAGISYGSALGIRRGINGLGSGVVAIDGTTLATNYTVATGQSVVVVPLSSVFSTRLTFLGQWSANVLPYEERFKIGTEVLARAFRTAEFAGDSGVGMRAELRARVPGLPVRFGAPSLFAYSDYGEVWQRDLSIEQHAATAGFGLRWDSNHITGSLELAKAVAASANASTAWSVLGALTVAY
jgi:hemolysin activation/secretion protein